MNPAPVLARVRGAVCVFSPDVEAPLWIRERCVQPVDDHEHAAAAAADVASAESREQSGMGPGEKSPC